MVYLAHPTRFERVAFAFGAKNAAFYFAVALFLLSRIYTQIVYIFNEPQAYGSSF
jgi:hypothetical protein